jgi:hypothetical protein
MQTSHKPYTDEFKKKLVALVRGGRTPEALSSEFEPSAQGGRLPNLAARATTMALAGALPGEDAMILRALPLLAGPRGAFPPRSS